MKVFGKTERFKLIDTTGNRTLVCYGIEAVDAENSTWHEVDFTKAHGEVPSIERIKDAIIADIDAETDARILNGYEFTPDGAEEPIVVWLSKESQTNFSEAQRLGIVPVTFKLNETAERQAIYHTFETVEELNRFYIGGVAYIQQCLAAGWQRKDAFDFTPYEEALNGGGE